MTSITDIIRKKRDGGKLSPGEIAAFVAGLADETLPREQASAMAMAVYFKGMDAEETGGLTSAMARSGEVIDWTKENLSGPVIDKHSTGGVGDKVSLALAPIAAACGCYTPMISGRGLGHSGGTLDKLDAIPGYRSQPGADLFRKTVASVGCAIIGQTSALAPADRMLYAIRDVTATVESIPLITASILSKKIAAGNDALVMDVKTGSGAFMTTVDDARALARSIKAAGGAAGLKTSALLTDMGSPLGLTAGNALEVRETVRYLTGEKREARLHDVTISLAAAMLVTGELAPSMEDARQKALTALDTGRAAEVFEKMVAALGGPADFLARCDAHLPTAQVTIPVYPQTDGYLAATDARAIGLAIISLGGGRKTMDDTLDLSTGFADIAPLGALVDKTTPLAVVHAANRENAERAADAYRVACTISSAPPEDRPLIINIDLA